MSLYKKTANLPNLSSRDSEKSGVFSLRRFRAAFQTVVQFISFSFEVRHEIQLS